MTEVWLQVASCTRCAVCKWHVVCMRRFEHIMQDYPPAFLDAAQEGRVAEALSQQQQLQQQLAAQDAASDCSTQINAPQHLRS